MKAQGMFVVNIEKDGMISFEAVDIHGRKFPKFSMTLQSAEDVSRALADAVAEARTKYLN